MRKLVGVMPLWDDEKDSIWMLPGYLDGLKRVGLDAFIFPLTDDEEELHRLADLCDGILLTGGHDVNPALYHESPLNQSVVWNDVRDRMDQTVIRYSLQQDKSILGICRGIQILNVSLGGTLFQDLPSQHPSAAGHHMDPPYDRPCHEVKIVGGTPLYSLLQKDRLPVNSIHHQAIRNLSPRLQEMAVSEDGLIEAVCMPGKKFVWGIQWHPEYWFETNTDCLKIFERFAKSME